MKNYDKLSDMSRHTYDDFVVYLKYILEDHMYGPRDKIIDLGCGNCSIENILSDYNFIGLDILPCPLTKPENVDYYQHDLEVFPYEFIKDKKYKCVICADVLEHTNRPDIICEYVYDNILDDDGVFMISVPNINCLDDKLNGTNISLFNHMLKSSTSGRWCSDHIRFFDYDSIIHMVREIGFKIDNISGGNCGVSDILYNLIHKISDGFELDSRLVSRVVGKTFSRFSPNLFLQLSK